MYKTTKYATGRSIENFNLNQLNNGWKPSKSSVKKVNRRKILLSGIQNYYYTKGIETFNLLKDRYIISQMLSTTDAFDNQFDKSFIKIFGDEKSITQIFYDYRTGVSFTCIKSENNEYIPIPKTINKIDIYKDVIVYDIETLNKIFQTEYPLIQDAELSLQLYEEYLRVNEELDSEKKYLMRNV